MKLYEFSPNTLKGSFTPDLMASKQWLIQQLNELAPTVDRIYILGSWYGNLSLLLTDSAISFDDIVNVDKDPRAVERSKSMTRQYDNIHTIVQDANTLDYDKASLVINTSCNDMPNEGWFDRIPKGTLVAVQTRGKPFDFELSQVLYRGKKSLVDPEGNYTRLMLIGLK